MGSDGTASDGRVSGAAALDITFQLFHPADLTLSARGASGED